MKRTYISLEQHPELMQVPWNSLHWLNSGKVHNPRNRFVEPEKAYPAMFRMMWRYYFLAHKVMTPEYLECLAEKVRNYKEVPINVNITEQTRTAKRLLPLKDWRNLFLYHVSDTLSSKNMIYYGFDRKDWDWSSLGVIVLPKMLHFVKGNVDLIDKIANDKREGRNPPNLHIAGFRLDV